MAHLHFVRCFLFAAHLVPVVSVIADDAQYRMMRRQNKGAMELDQLNSQRFLLSNRKSTQDPTTQNFTDRADYTGVYSVHGAFPGTLDEPDAHHFILFDFPKGNKNSNDCAHTTIPTTISDEPVHVKMVHRALCKYAAQNTAGARLPTEDEADFDINLPDTIVGNRPTGCFAMPCPDQNHSSTAKVCYFWNGYDGNVNVTDNAYPICLRHYFVNGTAISGDVSNGCPNNYEKLMGESDCRRDGGLLGYCVGAPFRTGDSQPHCTDDIYDQQCREFWGPARHNHYPLGCYIAPLTTRGYNEEGCVYYNFEETGWEVPTNASGLLGTPICRVSSTTVWSGLTAFSTTGGR